MKTVDIGSGAVAIGTAYLPTVANWTYVGLTLKLNVWLLYSLSAVVNLVISKKDTRNRRQSNGYI